MTITLVRAASLPWSNIANEFVGDDHGVPITLLVVNADPGRGAALHEHLRDEAIIVLEGEASLDDASSRRLSAQAMSP
jgi:mannose-6-phosphate isomerase-like protein (cupin superfamily)